MTFLQFITQKSGFGNTSWPEFIFIAGAIVTLIVGAFCTDSMAARYVALGFALLITTVLMYGTIRNFNGKQG